MPPPRGFDRGGPWDDMPYDRRRDYREEWDFPPRGGDRWGERDRWDDPRMMGDRGFRDDPRRGPMGPMRGGGYDMGPPMRGGYDMGPPMRGGYDMGPGPVGGGRGGMMGGLGGIDDLEYNRGASVCWLVVLLVVVVLFVF